METPTIVETFFASKCSPLCTIQTKKELCSDLSWLWGANFRQANYFKLNEPIPLDEWVHLALQYDSQTNTVQVFVNGILVGENTLIPDAFSNVFDGGIGYLTNDGVAKDWPIWFSTNSGFPASFDTRTATPSTNWEPDSSTLLLRLQRRHWQRGWGPFGRHPGTFLGDQLGQR